MTIAQLFLCCGHISSYNIIPEFIHNSILQFVFTQNNTNATPPIATREEDRVIYAGVASPGWNNKYPRQADNSTNKLLDPPVAIPDPYGWLRDDDRTNMTILEYLKSENEYTKSITAHLNGLEYTLYSEMLSYIQETDYSAPRPDRDYWYYTRSFEGSSYDDYYRAPKTSESFGNVTWNGTKGAPILPGEAAYLDVNDLAKNQTNCDIESVSISLSQELVAYLVDYTGGEEYELHIRNLKSGKDVTLQTTGPMGKKRSTDRLKVVDYEWGKDDNTLFYVTEDEAKRPYRLYVRQDWNTNNFTDKLLKEENDVLFNVGVSKSADEKYIFYESKSKETSETWYIDLTAPPSDSYDMKCISSRINNVLYSVSGVHHNRWYFVTDIDDVTSMKFMSAPMESINANDWELVNDAEGKPVFDGKSHDKSIDSVTLFSSHAVLEGREDGIPAIWVYSFDTRQLSKMEFDDAAYSVGLSTNYEYDADKVAVSYSSMLTPPSTYEISLNNVSQRRLLQTNVVPGYQKELYETNRYDVLSRDNKTYIPISVLYSKETSEKVLVTGTRAHIHLYGYGAYGDSIEANFDSSRLPLIKRGVVYVIAHVRGGGELGRGWYHGGKLLCKKNTFNDFVDVAKFLVANFTTPDLLSIEGRSAGGLLIGAAVNQAPELFRVALLGRPFVDVVATMTDSTIPMTSGEWIEWGNPSEEKYHKYMMSYSPVNNVVAGKKYPAVWLTGGLNDPRVAYWEPAKLAATLRHTNPNNPNPVCLKTDLDEGHFNAVDRYKSLKELAGDYSFLLDQLGLSTPTQLLTAVS